MPRTIATLLVGFTATVVVPHAFAQVSIETVAVANESNANDPATGGLYGGVAAPYRIGKYEVTNAQYVEFLNAKAATDLLALFNPSMTTSIEGGIIRSGSPGSYAYVTKSEMGNKPVNFVSWYDAIRFANWLHNGQGVGSTETGAYTVLGGTSDPSNGPTITRNPGASWFLTSENEWYKAAFHQPMSQGGDADNYWLYPTATNNTPYSDQPPGSEAPTQSNTANYYNDDQLANGYNDGYAVTGSTKVDSSELHVSDVGSYAESTSYYGTFDQGGNVWEWNEQQFSGPFNRGLRGGAFDTFEDWLAATDRHHYVPGLESLSVGFRVATIPEPSTLALAGIGAIALAAFAIRRTAR